MAKHEKISLTGTKIRNLCYKGKQYVNGASSRDIHWDSEVHGFGIRLFSTGRKSFVLSYRNEEGKKRLHKIGNFGDLTATEARKRAQKLKAAIADGSDPQKDRKEKRIAPTIRDLTDRYLKEHSLVHKRPNSIRNDRSMISRRILPAIGNKKVGTISRSDIERFHHSLQGTPYQANRILALLSSMFTKANSWEWRETNPCMGIKRFHEEGRERFLTPDELERVFEVLHGHANQVAANAIRLLVLTGARRTEVFSASWDQFDLDQGVWTKPSSHTKQKRKHRLPLNEQAQQILAGMKLSTNSEYLFPGFGENKFITDIKKFWHSVRMKADIGECRIHDLRHSYASLLASSGSSLPVIGALLGHTQQSTTQRYVHLMDDPLREATEKASDLISSNSDRDTEPEKPSTSTRS